MTTPEIAMQVRTRAESLEEAERMGIEAGVIKCLVELREFLNNQPELEAPAAPETPTGDKPA